MQEIREQVNDIETKVEAMKDNSTQEEGIKALEGEVETMKREIEAVKNTIPSQEETYDMKEEIKDIKTKVQNLENTSGQQNTAVAAMETPTMFSCYRTSRWNNGIIPYTGCYVDTTMGKISYKMSRK